MPKSLKTLVILLAFIAGGSFAVNAQHPRVKAEAERITGDRFTVAVRTPRGANVYAVRSPARQMLNAIDKGLADLFAVARKNRYTRRLNYSEYSIYVANADRTKDSSGNYSPDFAVPADQYAGTDFDQGGFIFAAGMVLAYSPMAFIIAEHTRDLDRMSNVVRYEGEHLVLYHNDRRRYEATKDHSQGGGHPILN
ncbi:MAG: hypothetical protein IPM50_05530 [Acidobacteriota bacterium]|nr:MAG: hypothetical protein IPM50_05530 [Acidobacteriota bacterium]